MAQFIYILCALTSLICAALLVRGYAANRTKLLLWSSLCFGGLALNNVLLWVDLALVPAVDLSLVRSVIALLAVTLLLIGLIWEAR